MNKEQIKKYEAYFSWQNKMRKSSGGKIKFSKRIVEPLRYYVYSLISFFIAKAPQQKKPCDILFLHASEKSKALQIRAPLIAELRKNGLVVLEDAQQRPSTILKKRLLTRYKYNIPFKYLFISNYIQFIVETYCPKIIITDRNGSIYSSFLKEAVQPYGKLVHMAHCVATDNFGRFSLIDYDYYFLYGTSSLDKIMHRQVRYGSTKAVLTGPYFSNKDFNLEANNADSNASKNILLFGIYPDLEKKENYRLIYDMVRKWAEMNPDFTLYFKPHPRSRSDYWKTAAQTLKNIIVLDPTEKLTSCLNNISITLSIYTNAVIDSALLNRPSLMVCRDNMSDLDDELDLEKFYLPRAATHEQLQENISTMLDNYSYYVGQAKKFAKYHLEYRQDSIEYITHCLLSITNNKEDFPMVKIDEKMDELKLSILADK